MLIDHANLRSMGQPVSSIGPFTIDMMMMMIRIRLQK